MAPPTKPTSVSRIALWPEPMANSVPEAHEPPSCMPTPNRKAPTNRPQPIGARRRRHRDVLEGDLVGQDRREQDAGGGEHQHVRAQRLALAYGDQLPPRGGEAEAGVEQHQAEGQADRRRAGRAPGRCWTKMYAAQGERDADAGEHDATPAAAAPPAGRRAATRVAARVRSVSAMTVPFVACRDRREQLQGREPTGVTVPPGNQATSDPWPSWPGSAGMYAAREAAYSGAGRRRRRRAPPARPGSPTPSATGRGRAWPGSG